MISSSILCGIISEYFSTPLASWFFPFASSAQIDCNKPSHSQVADSFTGHEHANCYSELYNNLKVGLWHVSSFLFYSQYSILYIHFSQHICTSTCCICYSSLTKHTNHITYFHIQQVHALQYFHIHINDDINLAFPCTLSYFCPLVYFLINPNRNMDERV